MGMVGNVPDDPLSMVRNVGNGMGNGVLECKSQTSSIETNGMMVQDNNAIVCKTGSSVYSMMESRPGSRHCENDMMSVDGLAAPSLGLDDGNMTDTLYVKMSRDD